MIKFLNLEKRKSWVGFIFCFAVISAAYSYFAYNSRQLNGQLFDLSDKLSWMQSKGSLFRTETQGNIESILFSKRSWDDFKLSTVIYNPKDCGLAYSYQGENEFHFIIFDVQNSIVLWGVDQGGRYTVLKKSRFDFPQVVLVDLKVNGQRAELFFNHQPHSSLEAPLKPGKVGLMNNAFRVPPTVFSDIAIEDRFGHHVNAEVFVPYAASEPKVKIYIFSAILFLLTLAGSIFLAIRFLEGLKPKRESLQAVLASVIEHPWTAYGVHCLAAIFIFWPFFSRGNILASSSDNLGQIYPLFIYSAENFVKFLQGQAVSLWNPYVHNGLPFFSNHWNMLYYPLNWPLFVLPPEWMLIGITVRSLLETFFIGILAYKFFQKEFGANHWALFSSLTYQLCSILIFSFTIFPTSSLMFALTLYLYFLWSWKTRKPYGNFFYLTISVVLLLTSANLAFVLYGTMVLAALTIYRLTVIERDKFFQQTLLIVAGSLAAGFLIAAVRIVPCILGVVDSNRLVENYFTIHDRFAMFIRLFIPEIVGWLGNNFTNALLSSNLHLIFRDINLPSNSQNAFFVYFGIAAALLFLTGLVGKGSERSCFWRNYALITLALGLMLQPFWGVFNIILFPFNHYSYFIIIIPLGFCAFVGYAGMCLEKQKEEIKSKLPVIIFLIFLVQTYILVFVTYLFPSLTASVRMIFLAMIIWYTVYAVLKKGEKGKEVWGAITIGFVQSLAAAMILLGATLAFIAPIVKKKNELFFITIPGLWCLFIIAGILGYYVFLASQKKERRWDVFFVPIFAVAFAVFLSAFHGLDAWLCTAPVPERNYLIDFLLGEAKFILIAVVFLSVLVLYANERLSKQAFWIILFFVLAVDLVGFNARFDNVVAPTPIQKAFYPVAYPYNDIDPVMRREMDLVNYRAHDLHKAGLHANENLIFKVPSYSGIMGHMPKRFSNFIVNFGYPKETVLIYPEESTDNERFLDLCAVKYKFTSPGQYEVRPHSLARMDLFSSYAVIENDEEMLARLKDLAFDPQAVVLLKENVATGSAAAGSKVNALKVDTEQRSTDIVTSVVSNPWPSDAVLLFAETYSSDWKAYVDEKPVKIVPANYVFMAVAVGQGTHQVKFAYQPSLFYAARTVSGVALGLFLLLSLVLWFKGARKS